MDSDVPETFLPTARHFPTFRKTSCYPQLIFRRIGNLIAIDSLLSDMPENVQPIAGGFREAEAGAPLKVVFWQVILHL
jgi:hypothetical protein